MGTTRVKIIDLAQKEEKAEKKISPKIATKTEESTEPKILENAKETESAEKTEKQESPAPEKKIKITKPKKAAASKKHVRGKKYQEAVGLVDKSQNYKTKEAFEILRKISFSKFDSTVELHINVVDKKIRGKVILPHAVATKTKEKKYLILNDKQQAIEGKQIIWGNEKTIAEIEKGQLKPGKDFDIVITSAKFMPALARVAKVLGPKGMMPNPKNGTITDDPAKILTGGDEGAYEYKCDPTAAIVHTKIGKLSEKDENLTQNLKALVNSIGTAKIKSAVIKSTMSPAIKIDVMSVGK